MAALAGLVSDLNASTPPGLGMGIFACVVTDGVDSPADQSGWICGETRPPVWFAGRKCHIAARTVYQVCRSGSRTLEFAHSAECRGRTIHDDCGHPVFDICLLAAEFSEAIYRMTLADFATTMDFERINASAAVVRFAASIPFMVVRGLCGLCG